MKDSGYEETLCLKLGGTNERTSGQSRASRGSTGQGASVVCGDVRCGCYGCETWRCVYVADEMLNSPGVCGSARSGKRVAAGVSGGEQCNDIGVFKKTCERLAFALPRLRARAFAVARWTTNFSRAPAAPSLLHGLLLKSATARTLQLSCRLRSWPRMSHSSFKTIITRAASAASMMR